MATNQAPTKLHKQTAPTLIKLAAQGATNRDAAAIAGISERTLYDWLSNPTYTNFADAYTRAQAQGRQRLVNAIHEQAPGDWRAAAWILERTDAKHWGKAEIDLTGLEAKLAAYLQGHTDATNTADQCDTSTPT